MSLSEQIQADLTAAMKARNAADTATLRLIVAAIRTAQVAGPKQAALSDEATTEILTREAKRRAEAAEQYEAAGRTDLAEKERAEEAIVRRYLPEQLGAAEVAAMVDEAIAQTGAQGASDLGKVMGALMPRVKGRADGKLVNALVRERLGA